MASFKSISKASYKVIRSVLFSVVLTVAGLVAILYVAVSLPPVQRWLCDRAETELSKLLGGEVAIESVDIFPFNEVRLHAVSLKGPDGKPVAHIGTLGAGIELWKLLTEGDVKVTYAEVIALNAVVEQTEKDGPLNIQFIIDALKPKKKKEQSDITVVLHNIVLRKSRLAFRRTWMPPQQDENRVDFNHVELYNVNADLAFPRIRGDEIEVDLRRMAFLERSGFDVKSLSVKAKISPRLISFSDVALNVGSSSLTVSGQTVQIDGYNTILQALRSESRHLKITGNPLYLSDFRAFVPQFEDFNSSFILDANFNGTPDRLDIDEFKLNSDVAGMDMQFFGSVRNLCEPRALQADLTTLRLQVSSALISQLAELFNLPESAKATALRAGALTLTGLGKMDLESATADARFELACAPGKISCGSQVDWSNGVKLDGLSVVTDGFDVGELIGNTRLGLVAADVKGNMSVKGKNIEGAATVEMPFAEINGYRVENISLDADKNGDRIEANIDVADRNMALNANGGLTLAGVNSSCDVAASVENFHPAYLLPDKFKPDQSVSVQLDLQTNGNNFDNIEGYALIDDLDYKSDKINFFTDEFRVDARLTDNVRSYGVQSDFLSADISGDFVPTKIPAMVRHLLHTAVPSFFPVDNYKPEGEHYANYAVTLKPDTKLYELLGTQIRPGVPVTLTGNIDTSLDRAYLSVDAPYIIKGKNKIIRGTKVNALLSGTEKSWVNARTSFPVKHGVADLSVDIAAIADAADIDLAWVMQENTANQGKITLSANIGRDLLTRALTADVKMNESSFNLAGEEWKVSPATIKYNGNSLSVNGLNVAHGPQFVSISGNASKDPMDVISVDLAGIDLKYIFDILNINYVDFGGIATGRALASDLFSGRPNARTAGLHVAGLTYNDALLGDAELESHWDNDEKMVAINADITGSQESAATVRGGIYVTRDSLSLDFNTRKINIEMLQPFMSGFTSSVKGRASGHLKLYGTFTDIDLGGDVFADEIIMKVDHTNVYYHGSDSVLFRPGRIIVPGIRLYDKFGNSAFLKGTVKHNFLHDASFRFDIAGARNLLVYNTDQSINPLWYGTVYASGDAKLTGLPGVVLLDVNMATAKGSTFTIELDDTRTALEYDFLTFSDKRKESQLAELEVTEEPEVIVNVKENEERERPTLFNLDMSLDVTPDANLIIVMDPAAGDKIRANGAGAMQMHYDSDDDELKVYGKYTIDKGAYNFSLQELILKNFTIERGSSISFNGDPLNGLLDITAAYKVNTNLTDLDPSFRDDPDLTRTAVPVNALLKVTGDINSPEINFDIDLPTVTPEVERKMRSIISTDDMMNRQVIYLLALNRFYSPEYSGGEGGGEFASVASSTISSQIQNIVGSLTDKFSVAPSLKSEKSDLSDMEFDVALSSSLFDNRLLLNGNLGYRDKSTSQTTFIGDFDVEYLLSRNGQLRLKAYNHFNDASYYLKSALTTQGIGIIYRREFDDPFKFLKKKHKNKKTEKSEDN